MIRLDTHLRKLQAVLGGAITTSQPTAIVCYTDKENESQKKFFIEAFTATLNSTTPVDICPAPDKVMVREIDSIHIRNNDTVAATVTVKVDDDGTGYEIIEASLGAGETLVYTASEGWKTISAYGQQTAIFNYIDFALGPYPDAERRMKWNDSDGTLDLGLKGGNVILQVGQEQLLLVKENDNLGIEDGKVYYFYGSNGTNKTVKKAIATQLNQADRVLGLATESRVGGEKGFINTFGLVRNIDTNHLTEGAPVYLSDVTAGEMISTRPDAPNHAVQIGYCIRQSASVGVIFVSIDKGGHLEYLHDVKLSNPITDGHVLTYDSALGYWKDAAVSSGVTSFSAGTTGLTPNSATTGDVTLAGTLGVANGGTGLTSFTANGVVYASGSTTLASGTGFVFDGTKAAIGTTIGSSILSVGGTIESTSGGFKFPDGTTQTTAAGNPVGAVLYLYNNFGGF